MRNINGMQDKDGIGTTQDLRYRFLLKMEVSSGTMCSMRPC